MEPKFHIIDFLVIGAYLAVLIWMGNNKWGTVRIRRYEKS